MKVLVRVCIAAVLTLGATGAVAASHDGSGLHQVSRADEHWCC